jgi:hypothetical protein
MLKESLYVSPFVYLFSLKSPVIDFISLNNIFQLEEVEINQSQVFITKAKT